MKTPSPSGFTLVELAIVMTIIGILIGGVLKGQQLIINARTKATIKHLQSFDAALTTFTDKYSQLPGDMINATQRLPNCTAPCTNGNGDWRVGVTSEESPGGGLPHTQSDISRPWCTVGGFNLCMETIMFWQHLAMADLITGVAPGADPTRPDWGETHPKNPMGTGWHAFYTTTRQDGINVNYSGVVIYSWAFLIPGATVLFRNVPVHYVRTIDDQIDDGHPNKGFVLAEPAGRCKTNDFDDGEYIRGSFGLDGLSLGGKDCVLYYLVRM